MKPWTCLGMALAAINCICKSARERNGNETGWLAGMGWTAGIWVCVLQAGILGAALLYYITDKHNIWKWESWDFGSYTEAIRPSLVTVLALWFYGLAAINSWRKIGWLIIAVGVSAIFGWIFNLPAMYYRIEYHSVSAVAFNTAVCFVLLGISLLNRN